MMESLHLGSQGTHMHVHVAIGNICVGLLLLLVVHCMYVTRFPCDNFPRIFSKDM